MALNANQIPSHDHTVLAAKSTAGAAGYTSTPGTNTYIGRSPVTGDKSYIAQTTPVVQLSPAAISPVGTGGAHENRQPFLVMNYIICYDGEFPMRP